MTTKHRAEELADSFLSVPFEIDFRQWVEIQELLRTIPALEAEIERLKESMCQKIQEEAAYCYDNGDYMLDYSDCQSIIKGTWKRPDYNFGIKKMMKGRKNERA